MRNTNIHPPVFFIDRLRLRLQLWLAIP